MEVPDGSAPIPLELRALIRRMATENSLWGEERIASELLVKLGIRVSPRTVRKYMPKPPAGQPRGDQRWYTFLNNHARAILACDIFIAVTATFRMLYVFVIIEHSDTVRSKNFLISASNPTQTSRFSSAPNVMSRQQLLSQVPRLELGASWSCTEFYGGSLPIGIYLIKMS